MENNKTKTITITSLLALVILIIGATYAYFVAQTGEGSQTDIRINANTVDTLTFETGDPITLTLDQENFAQGKGNQTGSTFAKALLTANNKTNSATEHYYMYLNIKNNTFMYTQDENTPEILLTITDTNNNEITSINGLTYKTVTDGYGTTLKGFDITTQNDLITIFENIEITTTSSITEEWNVTVTYVNYNADQSANAGKNFSANIMIQKSKLILLRDYVIALYTGTQGENSIYYHDSSLINGAGDNSYRFAGPSEDVNNFVCFGTNESPCPTDNLYRIIGVVDNKVKLIKYDYANSNLLGTDGDYYGPNEQPIKNYQGNFTSVDTYYWSYKIDTTIDLGSNTWDTSLLNKINLNTNFINNIGSDWASKISITKWKVGGNTEANMASVNPAVTYQNEIVNSNATNSTDNATEYGAKVGLMYVSDYGFAAMPSDWIKTMSNYNNAINNNWMYMGLLEWTITRISNSASLVILVTDDGSVGIDHAGDCLEVRPVFNLNSSVAYVHGSGSQSDPILIN